MNLITTRTLWVTNKSLPSPLDVPSVSAAAPAVREPLLEPSCDLLFDLFLRPPPGPPCASANGVDDSILLLLRSRPAPAPPLLERRSPLPALSSPVSSSSSLVADFSLRSALESIMSMFTVALKSWR